MWKCKHCQKEFEFKRATDKANHSRHCAHNPNREASYKKVRASVHNRLNHQLGEYKKFEVVCSSCSAAFQVTEREKLHPEKDHYYCSRSCANSVGGKAKVEKYGLTQYISIAMKYYKPQCAVCGITDVLDVHHIDEDRGNFHPSNLIFLCPNDHYRLHRNNDSRVKKVIEGHGTAWGGHFTCNEELSGVRIPDAPPEYFKNN